jgi:thiol peroxidase
LNLEGPEIKVGDKAPDAELKKSLAEPLKLSDTTGSVRILSVVPSLDTPVCATQTRRFYQQLNELPGVKFMTISCDLPVAMTRFCGAENIDTEKMMVLSDHLKADFGKKFGTLIPDLRVESRAVFVLDKDDTVRHAQYVPEIGEEPDYEAAINCAKQLV